MVRVYLSEEASRNLHKYRYKGTDQSLTYNYLLSPLSEYLVKFFPMHVAANTITYLGHICCLFMYMLPWAYCGNTLSCRLPPPLIGLCTAFYFGWIILDNIDGKQARRTHNATPLGLLFDHQVDALNVTFTTTFFGTVFMYGDSSYTIALWATGALPFYFATWEELYLGSLDLPFINGPCEGCVILGLMTGAAALLGPDYFVETTAFGIELRNCLMLFFVSAAVLTSLYNVIRVLLKAQDPRAALMGALPLFYFLSTALNIVLWSPAALAYSATRELMLCLGFCFAREIGFIQVAHCTSCPYQPLDIGGFFVMTSLTLNTWLNFNGSGVDEYSLLMFLTVFAFASYCHFVYHITQDMCKELQINVFSIRAPKVEV